MFFTKMRSSGGTKYVFSFFKVPGNQNLFTWLQTAERTSPRNFSWNPIFYMANRKFLGLVSSLPGVRGGGLETARGTLGQPRSFIGRLGVFVMSLWQCWFIQFNLLDSKLQPFHDHYADAKQHCDHASPKIAFQFARAATWNLSRHGHRNLESLTKKVP